MKHNNPLRLFLSCFFLCLFTYLPLQAAQGSAQEQMLSLTQLKAMLEKVNAQGEFDKALCIKVLKALAPSNEELLKVEKAVDQIEKVQGKSVILFLGATGAGKSTTINYLLGHTMCRAHHRFIDVDKTQVKESFAHIAHFTDVGTTYPMLYQDEESCLVYCDCPSFTPIRTEYDIFYSSLLIAQLIQALTNVQALVLCISEPNLDSLGGLSLVNTMQPLIQMFTQPPELYTSSIFTLFTKTSRNSLREYLYKVYFAAEKAGTFRETQGVNLLLMTMLCAYNEKPSPEEQRFFLTDPLDHGESRSKILAALQTAIPIPKEAFRKPHEVLAYYQKKLGLQTPQPTPPPIPDDKESENFTNDTNQSAPSGNSFPLTPIQVISIVVVVVPMAVLINYCWESRENKGRNSE